MRLDLREKFVKLFDSTLAFQQIPDNIDKWGEYWSWAIKAQFMSGWELHNYRPDVPDRKTKADRINAFIEKFGDATHTRGEYVDREAGEHPGEVVSIMWLYLEILKRNIANGDRVYSNEGSLNFEEYLALLDELIEEVKPVNTR